MLQKHLIGNSLTTKFMACLRCGFKGLKRPHHYPAEENIVVCKSCYDEKVVPNLEKLKKYIIDDEIPFYELENSMLYDLSLLNSCMRNKLRKVVRYIYERKEPGCSGIGFVADNVEYCSYYKLYTAYYETEEDLKEAIEEFLRKADEEKARREEISEEMIQHSKKRSREQV